LYARIGVKVVNLGVTDKQVAEQKVADLRRDIEREGVGLIAPQAMRVAASRALVDHVVDYIKDMAALGCCEKHIGIVESHCRCLLNECGWSLVKDINGDSFQTWRAKQHFAPKTVNEYLSAARAFCNWMVAQGRMSKNPLDGVKQADIRGKEVERRALTVDETGTLLTVAGDRAVCYLVAVDTGLRRGEIDALKWGDIEFEGPRPCIHVRAATTKNHESAAIPLHGELAAALLSMRPRAVDAGDRVFPRGLPRMRDMRKDFDAAGVGAKDSQGRKADFHSLRKTFDTRLQVNGVGPATAMTLMRHKDPQQTLDRYTHVPDLPLVQAINELPCYLKKGTEKGTASIVKTLPDEFATVHMREAVNFAEGLETLARVAICPGVSQRVHFGQLAPVAGFEPATK